MMDDPDVQALVESMEAVGLDQYVTFEDHSKGHILDHIYIPEIYNIKIEDCVPGAFISDHRFVTCAAPDLVSLVTSVWVM